MIFDTFGGTVLSRDLSFSGVALPQGLCYNYHFEFILCHYMCNRTYQFKDIKSLNYNAIVIHIVFTTFLNKNPNQIDTKTHIMKTHFLLETMIKLYSKNFTFTKEFSNKMFYMALLELFNNLHKSDNITIIPDIYPLVINKT